MPVTITNCANNYGPYQFPEKLVALCATRALDDRPLPLYSSLHHQREWLHVSDHCRAIEAVLLGGRIGETYLVGSGVEATIEQMADLVLDALGKPRSLKQIVPDRPGHDTRYLLDSSKLRRELGWAPEVAARAGHRRHGRLVRRPPVVVGAAAGRGRGRRARLGRRRSRSSVSESTPVRPGRAAAMRVLVTGAAGQLGRDVVAVVGPSTLRSR